MRIAKYLAIVFFIFILGVIYLANTGQDSIFFELVAIIPFGDKVGHVFLFGVFTLLANMGLTFRRISILGARWYIGTILVSFFVILEETSQLYWPKRTADIYDLGADAIGITLFTIFTWYLEKYKLSRGSTQKPKNRVF